MNTGRTIPGSGAFSENRVVDGVELEGLEYESAATWAANNLIKKGFPFSSRKTIFGSATYRSIDWSKKIGHEFVCSEACALAYYQANPIVADYLERKKMPANRYPQLSFFQSGNAQKGDFHHLIPAGEFESASRGDILYYQSTKYSGVNSGHAVLLASEFYTKDHIVERETGEKGVSAFMAVDVYTTDGYASTNAGYSDYGASTFLFEKRADNNYYLAFRKYTNPATEEARFDDLRQSDKQLKGFGRVDEKGIVENQ
jgi:hypothetical protein